MARLGLIPACLAVVLIGCSSGSNGPEPAGGQGGSGGSGAAGGTGGAAGIAAGTGGEGAGAGGSGAGGAGTGGSAAEPDNAHCSNDWAIIPGDQGFDCEEAPVIYGIPNGDGVLFDRYTLPAPMVAGEPYTFSIGINFDGVPSTYEIWGTDKHCGLPLELLAWSEASNNTYCTTFTPTSAHGEVIVVMRALHSGNYLFSPSSIAFCGAGGSCPAAVTGQARAPGVTLDAPLGDYHQKTTVSSSILTRDYFVGGLGRAVLRVAAGGSDDVPSVIEQGLFRLPATDPYGDGWYCIGAGSTITRSSATEDEKLELRNITRASCPAPSSDSLKIDTTAGNETATSSIPELIPAEILPWYSLDCRYTACRLYYAGASEIDVKVSFELAMDIGSNASGATPKTTEPVGFVNAFLITAPADGSAMRYTCGTSGSVAIDIEKYALEVSDFGAFKMCPGDPIDNDSLDFTLRDD